MMAISIYRNKNKRDKYNDRDGYVYIKSIGVNGVVSVCPYEKDKQQNADEKTIVFNSVNAFHDKFNYAGTATVSTMANWGELK